MRHKFEVTKQDADIFIYGKMDPDAANQILLSKVSVLKKNSRFSPMINKLQENGGKLWLIRDSRVEGLLTIQSLSYNKAASQWQTNDHKRYMLSKEQGWISNGENPGSKAFNDIANQAGGIIQMTEENVTPHLPGLLKILSDSNYHSENRVNPKVGEETTTKGYSRYLKIKIPSIQGHTFKLESTSVSLPESILIALSCPLTTEKSGEATLMKNPVTLVRDGITYERLSLLEKFPGLQEGLDFYPNTKLKTIINYVSATSLEPEEYLAKLQKVEEDINDPILLIEMMNPVLSPSGFSYEKSSIEQWIKTKQGNSPTGSSIAPISDPLTKEDIRGKRLVENLNLRQFIKAWPSFYEQQQVKFSNNNSVAS